MRGGVAYIRTPLAPRLVARRRRFRKSADRRAHRRAESLLLQRENIGRQKQPSPLVSLALGLRPAITPCLRKVQTTSRVYLAITWMVLEMSLGQISIHGKDRQPKGTHFDGARMPYAMFFRGGYAMHQGYVPPFAASHGCICLPGTNREKFFRECSRRNSRHCNGVV